VAERFILEGSFAEEATLRSKSDPEFEFPSKLCRWYWPIRSIGQLMVVVALSGLAMAVLPERPGTRSLPPGLRPPAVRAVQVIPPAQTPRVPDRFVREAPAGIDDAMIVTARQGVDDAMIVNPARLRGRPVTPDLAPEQSESAKAIPLWRIPAVRPHR
jgi:hypothetical protein